MSLRKSIRFSSFGGYQTFSSYWWKELLWYVIGLHISDYRAKCMMSIPGWMQDIYTFYHRGRYGWAPRDTWSLDGYLNHVLAGTLEYLAEHSHGSAYPLTDEDPNGERWPADLRRWAHAFSEDPQEVDIYDAPDYTQHRAEEIRRRQNLHTALKEIEPVWESLWD